MVLTRHLEKVLLQEKSRAKDVESEPPEIGAEDQPASRDALDDNGSGGEPEERGEETRSERFRDPPSEGADDVGSDRGEKENTEDGRSESLRDPPSGGEDDNGSDRGSESLSDPDSSYSDEEEEEEEILEPMRSLRMYFPPTEYSKKMKISTRCYLQDVFETFRDLRPDLTDKEKNWVVAMWGLNPTNFTVYHTVSLLLVLKRRDGVGRHRWSSCRSTPSWVTIDTSTVASPLLVLIIAAFVY